MEQHRQDVHTVTNGLDIPRPKLDWRELDPDNRLTPKQKRFLACFARTGNKLLACKESGISTYSPRFWQRRAKRRAEAGEPDNYLEVYQTCLEISVDTLSAAAHCRAVDGWLEPVYHEGVLVGAKRRFSDSLLIRLLQARSEEFGNTTTHKHEGDVKHTFELVETRPGGFQDAGSKHA